VSPNLASLAGPAVPTPPNNETSGLDDMEMTPRPPHVPPDRLAAGRRLSDLQVLRGYCPWRRSEHWVGL